ncbi:MAG TPA: hypothetical protein VFV65_04270 [Gemmatimonadales bacterium]|nr:hypothetical protein [Gemmatimonadales bacterium]
MRLAMLLSVLLCAAIAAPAAAQKTEDEARLVFTMGIGYTAGADLWNVEDQPILRPGAGFDLVDLDRNINGSIGILFSGMYFPKPSLGFVGEVFFMGIGLEDACGVVSTSPDPRTEEICASIDGATKSSSAVLLSVGPVLRAGADQPISPYIRGQVGLLFSNLSPITTAGTIFVVTDPSTGQGQEFQAVIYNDPSSTRVTPGFVFGAGITTALGKGWQLRLEARDNLVEIATVAGPTPPGVDTPEIVNKWKNLFSIVVAADIVLEKKRGRRY